MSYALIMSLLAFIAALLPIFTIVIKVNGTLTKLNITIEMLTKQMDKSEEDREHIHLSLNDHETRLTALETRQKYETR